ncbi:Probable serine/threonine-protein kinase [Seminavis robusta]|uniref:Probable serine/threonine-protein kinase n=1 Tax=Seminavis robusta TaxID=568900 RepID=A0A9N8DPJ7_9STRA|nr:Probable serine/threonine-protein kinase [Seminavis robusta]|eukprot:Sro169_g075280.1 Probable serine/threonine-protein kinase (599) ;mRNA; r:96732-98613
MQRRSFSEGSRKSSISTRPLVPQSSVNTPKGSNKKRNHAHGSFFSPSTIFAGCTIAALLFLIIETRLYASTVQEGEPKLFASHLPLPTKSLPDDKPRIPSEIEPPRVIRAPYGNTPEKFPPRVVDYDVPPRMELRRTKLILLDNQEDTGETILGKLSLKDRQIQNQVRNTTNTTQDDEDGGVEDKDAVESDGISKTTEETGTQECVPMAEWQKSLPVNCNAMHELDMLASIINAQGNSNGKKHRLTTNVTQQDPNTSNNIPVFSRSLGHGAIRNQTWNESQLKFLGQGWFRAAWKLDRQLPEQFQDEKDSLGETLVLKMLRPERDFTAEFYELHRIDAVAMERLSHSKFVLDVYGYCGQSALNEYANFRIPELSSLEKFDRQLRGKNFPRINQMKLKLAIGVATGVAHLHEVPADLVTSDGNHATMAHYDINPRNVAIVKGGMPKLNDFNVAHFLKWNVRTNQTCGFESRLHEPWWRAPEEVSLNATQTLTEAVDVWSLGNLLFHILTTHSPRGKMKPYRMEAVRQDVLQGIPPALPKEFATSKDPAVAAFRKAMEMCFKKDPKERSSSREVSNTLLEAYHYLQTDTEVKKNKKKHVI